MFLRLQVSHILNRIRQETDLEDSDFVTDEGLIDLFNETFRGVRTQVLSLYGDESLNIKMSTVTLDDNRTGDLPTDLHNIHSVLYNKATLHAVSLANLLENINHRKSNVYAIIGGDKIKLPDHSTIDSIEIYYYPKPPTAVDLTDEIDFFYNEDRWVILEVASEILRREETSNTSVLERLKQLKVDFANQMTGLNRGSNTVVTRRRLRRR